MAEMQNQAKEDRLAEEDAKEEKMEEMPRLKDMVKEKEDWSLTGPDKSSENYVWGTGSAEMAPEAERLKTWMDFTKDPRYHQIRRASMLRPLGVDAQEVENPDQLLTYFPWPGHPDAGRTSVGIG